MTKIMDVEATGDFLTIYPVYNGEWFTGFGVDDFSNVDYFYSNNDGGKTLTEQNMLELCTIINKVVEEYLKTKI